MKTPEEIQKLSYKYSDKVNMFNDWTSHSIADAVTYGYTQCQNDMADEIVKLEEKLKLIEHISDEMAKDLIEQLAFFDGGFESVSKYYNYKQSLNKQD